MSYIQNFNPCFNYCYPYNFIEGPQGPQGSSGKNGLQGATGLQGPTGLQGATGIVDPSLSGRILGYGNGSNVQFFDIPIDTSNNNAIEVYIVYKSDGVGDQLRISEDGITYPNVNACSTPQAANNSWGTFVNFQSSSNTTGTIISNASSGSPVFVKVTVPRYVAQGIERRQCACIDATNIDLTAAGKVAEQIRGAISFRDVDVTKQINYLRIFTTGTNIFYYSYTVVGYKYF